VWQILIKGPHRLVWEIDPDEIVYHPCHACHLLATKYWDSIVRKAAQKEEWLRELMQWVREGGLFKA